MQYKEQQVTDCMHFHHCDCNGFTQYLDGVEQEKRRAWSHGEPTLGVKLKWAGLGK